MTNKKIDIGKLRGKFKLPNLQYVPLSEINAANELRLHYEISFAIGLTLLGVSFNNSNIILWIVTSAFIIFGIISLVRYLLKQKNLNEM